MVCLNGSAQPDERTDLLMLKQNTVEPVRVWLDWHHDNGERFPSCVE